MKVRVIDLMKCYQGDGIKLDSPESIAARHESDLSGSTVSKNVRRGHRPLLVAAMLLLVVTASVATPFVLSRTAGHQATTEGGAPAESVQSELPSELPATFSTPTTGSDALQEATPDTVEETRNLIPSYEITGARVRDTYTVANATYATSLLEDDNLACYGNIVNMDGTYYTLTDNGPELLATTKLQTTLELYGSWEVDIDYAIVDGALVFHDNSSTDEYAIIDGEKVFYMDYVLKDRAGASQIEWTPSYMAKAEPVDGSADTVKLTIRLDEKAIVDRCSYTFFYNIFTGEITDPLANVPELFERGSFSSAVFNSARTRAILHYWSVGQVPTGESVLDGAFCYICDLTTGEMILLDDLAEAHMPEAENSAAIFSVCTDSAWVDDDTLLYSLIEKTSDGAENTEAGPDICYWLCSYNIATGTVNYQKRGVQARGDIKSFNQPYIHCMPDETRCFQIMDTATGTCYVMEQEILHGWAEADGRVAYYEAGEVYLVDITQRSWVKLSDYMEIPEESENVATGARLLTDDWLCLMTEDTAYCYHIPDGLPMTPLTEK